MCIVVVIWPNIIGGSLDPSSFSPSSPPRSRPETWSLPSQPLSNWPLLLRTLEICSCKLHWARGGPFCEVLGAEWHMIYSYLFFASSSTPILNEIEQSHLLSPFYICRYYSTSIAGATFWLSVTTTPCFASIWWNTVLP
jgi:hypothetical protein